MRNTSRKYSFITIFIGLSFLTRTLVGSDGNQILSRLAIPDAFGLFAIIFGLTSLLKGIVHLRTFSFVVQGGLFAIVLLFLPILFSYDRLASFLECVILLFLLLLFVIIFETFKDRFLSSLVPLLIWTLLLASLLGFYDLFASSFGLSRIFSSRTAGEPLSGFKNAGQAGAYFLVFLTMLIPLRFSVLYNRIKPLNKRLLNLTLVLGCIFLLFTAKIAAYAGIVAGYFLFLFWNRKFKILIGSLILIVVAILAFPQLEQLAPQTYHRITYKYQARIIENLDEDGPDDFFQENYGAALDAFEERPWIGSGIGAFHNYFHENEVHSTYLKMLGEAGILGTLGYLIFIFSFVSPLIKINLGRRENEYVDYLKKMTPFIIGCFVSWAYTYHFRKREFWILVAVVFIVYYNAIRGDNKINDNEELNRSAYE